MIIPEWVRELVAKVCLDYGHGELQPEILWRWKFRRSSSGFAYNKENRISITAGKDRDDQRLVLLHELAHWLRPTGEHHSSQFWDLAFNLYRNYGVKITYAVNREKHYRKEAFKAYRRGVEARRAIK